MNILVLDSGRRGWAAASAFALMEQLPSKFEQRLLALAKGRDKSVAARSLLALSTVDSGEVISGLFNILSEARAEPLANSVRIPADLVVFLRELVCAVLLQIKERSDSVQSAVKDTGMRKALTNLQRLQYACFLDGSNIFPLIRVTERVLAIFCLKYVDEEGPHLSELFHSESEFDRLAAIHIMSGISVPAEGLKHYRRAFPPDELAPYLESAKDYADLLSAIDVVGELRYEELLPELYAWLDPDIDALLPVGFRGLPIGGAGKEVVVSWACQAIGLIKPKDRESIFLILSKIWKDSAVKNDIIKTLEAIGPDKEAMKTYETIFSKSTPATAENIAALLGEVGSEETAIYLNKLMNDISQPMYIRDAAWEALQTIKTRFRVRIDLEEAE